MESIEVLKRIAAGEIPHFAPNYIVEKLINCGLIHWEFDSNPPIITEDGKKFLLEEKILNIERKNNEK